MTKDELKAAFEKTIINMAEMEEPPVEDWAYKDGDIELNFLVFCAGYNLGAAKND